jgi:hypothetical protein
MPSGAAVTVYEGKRGRTFRVKHRDAAGRQVQQTLGREADGWTRQRAERELGKLLDPSKLSGYMRKAIKKAGSRGRSAPCTTYATRRSRTMPRPATPPSTSRRGPATRRRR